MRADIDDLDKDESPPGLHLVEDAQRGVLRHSRYQNQLSGAGKRRQAYVGLSLKFRGLDASLAPATRFLYARREAQNKANEPSREHDDRMCGHVLRATSIGSAFWVV
jgi:hypothetical protein